LLFNRNRLVWLAGLGILFLGPASGESKVFYSKEEALKIAFPQADTIETRTFIMTADEHRHAEEKTRARIDSKLFTFYVGKKNKATLGYAAIDSHVVRTLPETFMVVLSPEGVVQTTVILAFHEPLEYLPSDRWLDQFREKTLSPELWVGREIAGIAGSTLTSHALMGGVRKVLALFNILLKEKR
jgi:hypothetical protein